MTPPSTHQKVFCYHNTPKGNDWGRAVAIQPDGKIIVVGVSDNGKSKEALILRYNSDGTLDSTFGKGGIVTYKGQTGRNSYGFGVALQSDGKAVVVGSTSMEKSYDALILRYNTDGSLDSTFGIGGAATYKSGAKESQDLSFGVALQPDGKIAVVSTSYTGKNYQALILRYNQNGTLDSTFGTGGAVTYSGPTNVNIWGRSIALQLDGKIIIVGVSYAAQKCDVLTLRYNSDGSPDKTFGTEGAALSNCPVGGHDWGRALALQPDGKIIVAGNTRYSARLDGLVIRYNTNGTPDTTFGNGGVVNYKSPSNTNDWCRAAVLQPDGKILIVGHSISGKRSSALALRYNSDGTPDSSFGKGGLFTSNCPSDSSSWTRAVAIQPDGKIVAVGYADIGKAKHLLVLRYKSDGTLDASPGQEMSPKLMAKRLAIP